MIMWSNKKAVEDEKADNIMTGVKTSSKKIIKQMRSKLLSMSAPIKPFKGQEYNIPGLQSPNAANRTRNGP